MQWKLPNHRIVRVIDSKYRINYDKKAPSKGAQEVKDFIKENFSGHIWFEEFRIPKTRLRVDFLNATLRFAIEFHGRQHTKLVPHFHKNLVGFVKSIKRDSEKGDLLALNNIKLIEIFEDDLPLTRKFFHQYGYLV